MRVACLILLLAPWSPLASQARFSRTFGTDEGLSPAFVVSLAQDSSGFLWVGTGGGLYRYDGVSFRRWAPDSLRSWVIGIAASPKGALVAIDDSRGAVYEVEAAGVHPISGPTGAPLDSAISAAFDHAGGLWIARREALLHREPAGTWSTTPRIAFDGAFLRRVVPEPDGGVLVVTLRGVWRARFGETPELVQPANSPVDVLPTPDGRLFIATFGGEVGVVERDRYSKLAAWPNRAISLALRGRSVWVAYDHHLVALEPGHTPESLGMEDGVSSGGPLLVDHEGSLWLGTSGGLMQFPEPDTRIWTERDGIPSRHTRYLARTGDTVWVSTWRGSAGVALRAGSFHAWTTNAWSSLSRMFVDAQNALWAGSVAPEPGLYAIGAGRVVRRGRTGALLYSRTIASDGSTWLATDRGLLVTSREGSSHLLTGLPFESDSATIHAVLVDRAGRTWVASDRKVCRSNSSGWQCDEIDDGHHVSALLEQPSGAIWATMNRGGIWRFADSRWAPVPGALELTARDMQSLVPSRDGGIWIIGTGSVLRVREATDTKAGWRETERIGAWHGLHNDGVIDLLEDEDGSLWLTTGGGLVRIPAEARHVQPAAPRVLLGEARVDGAAIPVATPARLAHDRNRIELRFAAMSYRDPSLIRYEVRLSPGDSWDRVRGEPVFRWVDLPPGNYRAEVRASLDGTTWTQHPASFRFRVLRPWYLSPWAIAAALLLLGGVLAALYRVRVASLLELERQRTRIAMDLHDEMGSGLGSIGILSSMLSSGQVERGEDTRLAGEIARTAGELGTTLSGIVWSLTPRAGTIEEMAGRLAEQGRRLCVVPTEFVTAFPNAWPGTTLNPAVRRNALLIVLEALHNAARHSGAKRIALRIATDGSDWRIEVEDDGSGMNMSEHSQNGGLGLASMRERAEDIHASLEWLPAPAGGTIVRLQFNPRGRVMPWTRLAGRAARVT